MKQLSPWALPLVVVAALLLASPAAFAQQNKFVWFEAENPRVTNFPPAAQNPFKPASVGEADVLSGGAWIGTEAERAESLFLEYDLIVPAPGAYTLLARKFWKHGPFRWRFDDQPWQSVDKNAALLDDAPLRQFVNANWVEAGAATLSKGRHVLRVELTENKGAAAFDAFVLTRAPFVPRGKLKPGEKYDRAPAGWFPFEPEPDPFTVSPIDLRRLNETFAGQHGFIQAKNGGFVHQTSGAPVRFWAVNAGNDLVHLPPASLDYLARSLAKKGVNLVRLHGPVWGGDFHRVDPAHLDKLFRFVAAMKKQGIYSCLSIYFPLWLRLDDKSGFAGYPAGGKNPFALLFFNPDFQAIYRNWWRAVLTTPSPYNGNKPLSADPAVAFLEMVNEDSYFFWTFTPYENIPAEQMAILEKQFGDWLVKKHGGVDKAFAAWKTGAGAVRGDDAPAGRAGFIPLWEVFGKKNLRAQNTVAFLTDSQRAFFAQTRAFLKKDLGAGALVQGSNWITADAQTLGPLDKYTNTVGDFMDHHGYFGGPHKGPRASYALSAGDTYDDRSALLWDDKGVSLPLFDPQYNNLPSAISEINWTTPNRFRADLPLVSAAYGALQGTDAVFFFALAGPSWQSTHTKFGLQTPALLGQFPAAALIYRKGLVRPAAPVVHVNLKLADLLALQGGPAIAPANLDELRARDLPLGTAPVDRLTSLDPLAFLVGKVAVVISNTSKPSQVADLGRYIDRAAKTVRSQTGELGWNGSAGRVLVNAPRAQGATGFLARAGKIGLKNLTINTSVEYGTILLVSLDDKPLATSSRMLLQVMSEDQNFGWDAPGTGVRAIKSLGGPPIVVKKLSGTVGLTRPDAARLSVTPLDANGYPAGTAVSAKAITLNERTLYYLIESRAKQGTERRIK